MIPVPLWREIDLHHAVFQWAAQATMRIPNPMRLGEGEEIAQLVYENGIELNHLKIRQCAFKNKNGSSPVSANYIEMIT